jgi:hypothetical protein
MPPISAAAPAMGGTAHHVSCRESRDRFYVKNAVQTEAEPDSPAGPPTESGS